MRKFLMMLLVASGVGALVYNELPAMKREVKIMRM